MPVGLSDGRCRPQFFGGRRDVNRSLESTEGCDQLVIKDRYVPEPFMPDRA